MVLSGNGLLGQYYDSDDLSGVPAIVRTDALVDFDWGTGAPDAALGADNFSVRWTGQVEANFTEPHTFIVNANDGARLWVNGRLLMDEFAANTVNDATANINLIAGRRYDLQLEFREITGDADVTLEWSSPSTPRELIPQSQLFAAERGSIYVSRFEGVTGGNVSSLTSASGFPDNPTTVSPVTQFAASSNAGDNFGRHIQGLLHAPVTGEYRFFIAADNTAELWLSNTAHQSERIRIAEVTTAVTALDFTANAEQQSAVVHLVAGQSYFIEALHVDDAGEDHLAVAWQRPDVGLIEVIPGAYLSPSLPVVKAYAQQPVVSESSPAPAHLTVVRSGPVNNPLNVAYDLGGSASNGTDYQTLSGSVTIPAGQASITIDIQPLSDSQSEGDEFVEFTLRDGPGYDVGLKSERAVLVTLQDDRDVPAGGVSLWNGAELNDFQRFGANFSSLNVPGIGDVIQVQIDSQPGSPFSVQLRQTIDSPVAAGDIVYAEFRVRSIGGAGQIAAVFEDVSTFAKSLNQGLDIGTEWTRVQLPFTAIADYNTGQATFGFHLGFQAQTLQFADLRLLTFGPPRSLAPETAFDLNNISGTWGTAQQVAVTGQPFDFAYQVETETVPSQNWHLQATERNDAPVNTGDTMRISFAIRAVAGDAPSASMVVQRTNGFSTIFSSPISPTADWQMLSFDIDADADYGPNGLQVAFNLGYALQTIEIGGFHWENQNNLVDLGDLPRQVPAISYGGRDGLDAWRSEADSRIESLRKSSVTVQVVDSGNVPLDGAVVSLQQTQHGFRFGSAINAFNGKLDPNGNAQALKYQSEIKRLFNTVVAENSMKWPSFLSDRARALQLADFATQNDMTLRGHNAIWPSRSFMPASVWSEYDSRVASEGTTAANAWLKTTIEARFDDVISTFRGIVSEWDVVNEPYTNNDVMAILGDDFVIDLYQRFRDADPNMKLALNDYNIFTRNGGDSAHRQNFDSWLQRLSNANLLDVIGVQSHYGETSLTDMNILGQLITSYSTQYAAPVAITEFDVNTRDLQLQADYLRDFMTMSFSQPGVDQFLHWGFWENSHWLPDAALYRSDFSIKPNGQAYEDLVFGSWWTDTTGTTRAGAVSAQAFIGQYDVLVQYNGNTYNANVDVDASGASSVTIVLNDVGTPVLSLNIQDNQLDERDGTAATTATVSRTGDLSEALIVTLASSDSGEATLPSTVTIAAGQSTSPVFAVNAIDDGVPDAAQLVTLTATASDFDVAETQITVIDALSHRMSNLTVRVQDQNGNPLPGATIDVAMAQHGFQFGTQVRDRLFGITQTEFDQLSDAQKRGLLESGSGSTLIPDWTDVLNYRQAVYDNFNHIVPTNGLQWITYQNAGPSNVDTAVTVAQSQGFGVTGHAVVWGNDAWPTPTMYRPAANPDPQVFHDALIAERLSNNGILARYSGAGVGPTITDWDVLNEPINERYYSQTFAGAGIYPSENHARADFFLRARALRPGAKLAINEYNIINSGGDAAAQNYRDLVNNLLALGAPIDVIKVQAHIARADISKADITRRLDILAETGLPIVISEFDMRDDAGQLSVAEQERTFRDFLEAAFEHPAVDGFVMWGFWDAGHWRGNGPLYDTDWNVKAEAAPWFDLVQGDWKPNLVDVPVDAAGTWIAPAGLFQGDYDISATFAGVTTQLSDFDLDLDGNVVLTIEAATLSLSIDPTSISENGGEAIGTVTRNTDTASELIVALASSDTSEATVPGTVTIPAGQDSATFTITGIDDMIADGTKAVTISASAADHIDASGTLDITDDDSAAITIQIDVESIKEDGGTAQGTVTRNSEPNSELVVMLTSSDVDEATVPASVTIPAGSLSATFLIMPVNDEMVTGDTYVVVTSSANGHAASKARVLVIEDDQWTWTKTSNPFDVNDDGFVSPIDALLVINFLNGNPEPQFPALSERPPYFYDVNGDQFASAIDALLVINELNKAAGEGEATEAGDSIWPSAAPLQAAPLQFETDLQKKRRLAATSRFFEHFT